MMGEDGNDNRDLSNKLKTMWKNLPKSAKLYLLGGVVVILLIILGGGVLMGLMPSNFLDFSNDAQDSSDLKAEYEEYWAELCEDGDASCTEEQLEKAKKLEKDQTDFYNKLRSLAKKYSISQEQKYIVLTTLFYDMDIDDFTTDAGAFDIDDTDEINYEVQTNSENVYKREKDSLKELIKQFKINTAVCHYTSTNENGETVHHADPLVDQNNKTFSFNFFDKFNITIGLKSDNEEFEIEKQKCQGRPSGNVKIETSTSGQASIEGYYKYLKESTYFDDKPHLRAHFAEYAKNHNLSTNLSTWPEEEKQIVREDIIEDIKLIVAEYVEEKGLATSMGTGKAYWWPIGSSDTTEEGGVKFASGPPETTHINSPFGYRIHPISGEYKLHNGVDIHGVMGSTNIIASLGGTVSYVNNTCASSGSNGCGGGFGNYVEIVDTKGNVTIYAHMYKDSITVAIGDPVSQGQVIGKVGSSGNSTGAHLHFSIKVNGSYQQPLDYVDPNDPRPEGLGLVDFNTSRYTKEEFIAKLEEYYSEDGVCNSSSSQFVTGCTSFKNEVLNHDGAKKIYEIATTRNLNPELVVARSLIEGYSPGTDYNYFGYGCTNTGGKKACWTFTSFSAAMEEFFKNISKYESVEAMMSKYAFLGSYWYTGEHPGLGGCYYAKYIYPDGIPSRVVAACDHPDGYCSADNTANCVETTQEDQDAYTAWQVGKMASVMDKIFG